MTKPKPKPATWTVCDDGCSMRTGAKALEVVGRSGAGFSWSFPIEHTSYTGQHTAKGRRLAKQLARTLDAIERHRLDVEARLDERGHPRA